MPPPLKLTPFERYMLADDRPCHPMAYLLKFKFSGKFDRAAFESALLASLKRQPLLCARLEGETPKKFRWVAAPDPTPYIDYGKWGEPFFYPGSERIDLKKTTGLRIWVRSGEDRTEIRFQFHHACADGMGAYRFVEDVLCNYEIAVHGENHRAALRPLDPELIERRNRLGMGWLKTLRRVPVDIWGVVVGLATFFLGRPVELYSPGRPPLDEQETLQLLDWPTHEFTPQESRQLAAICRQTGATFNDLLLRELMVALQQWNVRHDPGLRGRMIRITIAINLRSVEHERLPAANVVAMVFLDRRLKWYRNIDRLLATIKLETKFLKFFGLTESFLRCVSLLENIPGATGLLSRSNRCHSTTMFSNGGRLWTQVQLPRHDGKLIAGELILESVESAPPVRPHMNTGFTFLTYTDRLVLVLNYDRYAFTPETAGELLEVVVRQVQQTALSSAGKGAEQLTPVS